MTDFKTQKDELLPELPSGEDRVGYDEELRTKIQEIFENASEDLDTLKAEMDALKTEMESTVSELSHSDLNDDEATKHRLINDSGTLATEIFSAEKFLAEHQSGFKARQSGGQSDWADSTWVKQLYTTEDYDLDSEYTSSRFTCKTAGKYIFTCAVQTGNEGWEAGESLRVSISRNGSHRIVHQHEFTDNITNAVFCFGGAYIHNLAVDDYVEVFIYHTRGGDTARGTSSSYNHFSGQRVAL